jgi:hypothetical protein
MKSIKSAFFVILCLGFVLDAQAQDQEYNLDETYSINKNGTIHLNSDDAEVTIKGSDRKDVHLVVYYKLDVDGWEIKSGDKFEIEVEDRNGDLYIREADYKGDRVLVGSISEEYRISIEAPRDVAFDIKGDDGTYEISEINSGITMSADDSDIKLTDVRGDRFFFDIDDSTVGIDEGRGNLNLELDDSDFRVRNGAFSEIDAVFDDTDVNITTTLSDNGTYSFNMEDSDLILGITGGGEFNIHHDDTDISTSDNFERSSSDEDYSVYHLAGGKAHIDIDSDDGDIDLRTI